MDNSDPDRIQYSIEDYRSGSASLRVLRKRDSSEKVVYTAYGNNFLSALNSLVDYHSQCLMENDAVKANTHIGMFEGLEFRPWKLSKDTVLPSTERSLLENIVKMHNQVVNFSSQV